MSISEKAFYPKQDPRPYIPEGAYEAVCVKAEAKRDT